MSVNHSDLPALARNVRAAMKSRGVTYAMLSNLADLNPTSLVRILSGKTENPRYKTVERISRALNIPADDLLLEDGFDPKKYPSAPSITTVAIPEPVQESLFGPPAKGKAPKGTAPHVPGMLYVDGFVKDLFRPTRAVPIPAVLDGKLTDEEKARLFAVSCDQSYDTGPRQDDLLFVLQGEPDPRFRLLLVQGREYTAEVVRREDFKADDATCCGSIAALERSFL